ncbi:hypothetical protein CSOJ01_12926 [Colletotrichum sojae]|uniref:Uncharacterized protein n=1 Tax=Colletotrichum sojae TaxID=2175907 RepID=A0A8H6MKZ0_9PEZI|nr:hypothetical protein CSOJ01_12926 [Colletotrichum sojae]
MWQPSQPQPHLQSDQQQDRSPDGVDISYVPSQASEDQHKQPGHVVVDVHQPGNSSRSNSNGGYDSSDYNRGGTEPSEDSNAARSQGPKSRVSTWTVLADVFAIIPPLAIVVFLVLVFRLDGTSVANDSHGSWRNAITVLATLFPILFASIVGRLMSEIARWKLEKGSTVGTLEQLMGSRTVGSTIHTLFEFRTINLLGLGLLATWAFSPLGAQAILRTLRTQPVPDVQPLNVVYYDTLNPSNLNTLPINNALAVFNQVRVANLGYLATQFASFVSTPPAVKQDPVDLWGNVRIPYLDPNAGDEWTDVPSTNVSYSSFTGIQVAHTSRVNASFTIESNYMHLACNNITKFPANFPVANMTNMTGTFFKNSKEFGDNILKAPNGTYRGYANHLNASADLTSWALAVDRFVDGNYWGNQLWALERMSGLLAEDDPHDTNYYADGLAQYGLEKEIEAAPSNLLFQLIYQPLPTSPTLNIEAQCVVLQKYVESQVNCTVGPTSDQQGCRVVAQRPSRQPHPPEAISHVSLPHLFYYISREVPQAGKSRPLGNFPDFALRYLTNPDFEALSSKDSVDAEAFQGETFGARLGLLLNTYVELSQVRDGGTSEVELFSPNATATGDSSTLVDTFVVDDGWMAMCLLSAIVLFLAGVCSVVFAHMALGPEVLGYVSTMVRDSRFVDLMINTSWLDGSELSGKIRSERVRYGFTHHVMDGQPLLGIGYQTDTERIKDWVDKK